MCMCRTVTPFARSSMDVTTVAGRVGEYGDRDGPGAGARFNSPQGLAADSAGNVFIADRDNQTIRKISPDGTVSTLAGVAGSAGASDGKGPKALFFRPSGIAVDASGNVFVSDTRNFTIREIPRPAWCARSPDTRIQGLEPGGSVDGPAEYPHLHCDRWRGKYVGDGWMSQQISQDHTGRCGHDLGEQERAARNRRRSSRRSPVCGSYGHCHGSRGQCVCL